MHIPEGPQAVPFVAGNVWPFAGPTGVRAPPIRGSSSTSNMTFIPTPGLRLRQRQYGPNVPMFVPPRNGNYQPPRHP